MVCTHHSIVFNHNDSYNLQAILPYPQDHYRSHCWHSYFTHRIFTALCCLDREKTPAYQMQVVATDGGGLKGKMQQALMRALST